MPVPPKGTVTFLFTDVEGSTALWEEHPHAMDACLRAHDHIVRSCVAAHDGYVFSTGGDSFAVAFATAHAALDAAVDVQQALSDNVWAGAVTLRVRMGLHTGEAIERADDYFGPPVNRAARLMAAAHGGQILCSEVTARLLADRRLLDLGLARLKDLSEPEHVHQPIVDGLQTDFPPIRSLDIGRHNLPTQRNVLLGRGAELARVIEMVGDHRLVTLSGAGGCGKTRLAVAVAAELVERFGDGVFLVELAPVVDSAQVSEVVVTTLGLSLAGAAELPRLARFLADQEMLLVLDNCEHLIGEAAAFVDVLLNVGSRRTSSRRVANRSVWEASTSTGFPRSTLRMRSRCSSSGPPLRPTSSAWVLPTRTTHSRCVVSSTGCPSRSNWPPVTWRISHRTSSWSVSITVSNCS